MTNFYLNAEKICKYFSPGRYIFRDINFSISNGEIQGVTGANGSGKSTFLKIIAGVLMPTSGEVQFSLGGDNILPEKRLNHLGFVSPYLNLYEEFSLLEILSIFSGFRNIDYNESRAISLIDKFGLSNRRNDPISDFSSGMKQRAKYILALYHSPEVLILDEPMTNLDEKGIDTVKEFIELQINSGGGVIIATNDERELLLCNNSVSVESK